MMFVDTLIQVFRSCVELEEDAMGNQSEVARLIQQIGLEYQSAQWGLSGYAEVARHEVINAKYGRLGELVEQLGEHVGEDEAMGVLVKVMDGR